MPYCSCQSPQLDASKSIDLISSYPELLLKQDFLLNIFPKLRRPFGYPHDFSIASAFQQTFFTTYYRIRNIYALPYTLFYTNYIIFCFPFQVTLHFGLQINWARLVMLLYVILMLPCLKLVKNVQEH